MTTIIYWLRSGSCLLLIRKRRRRSCERVSVYNGEYEISGKVLMSGKDLIKADVLNIVSAAAGIPCFMRDPGSGWRQ